MTQYTFCGFRKGYIIISTDSTVNECKLPKINYLYYISHLYTNYRLIVIIYIIEETVSTIYL